ncbi:MAG: class I SAM-dependent methyltransferase [Planctomycetes bacterium]|nr:class I SAM-dependent methyltransferase [Planctomycetota bacterium]
MHTKKPWRLGTRAQLLWRGLRYARILPYVSIDGWLSVDEAIALYELAQTLPHEHPLSVEIGTRQGKATVCLARGLQGKNAPRLCCIDPFVGGATQRADFERNLRGAGIRELVDVQHAFGRECAARWHEPIDMLFLHGDHDHEAVARDYRDWSPHVRPGGYLVMHEGPQDVVRADAEHDLRWVEAHRADGMLVVRRATT